MRRRGSTGVIIKNDVHARGCPVGKDGMLIQKHRCEICEIEFTDVEDVYYVFSQRGTQSATSAYYHPACVTVLKREPSLRWSCRICNKKEADLRFSLSYGRGVWCHYECLPKVPKETVPVSEIPERVRRRTISRLKRGTLYYSISLDPYEGLKFIREKEVPWATEKRLVVKVRTYDGRINSVNAQPPIRLMRNGRWVTKQDLYLQMHQIGLSETDHWGQLFLRIWNDFTQYYDSLGRPKGERLDSDFRLRFLLKYGNSMEGVINELKT